MWSKAIRFFHTISHLKPVQIEYQVRKRLRVKPSYRKTTFTGSLEIKALNLKPSIPAKELWLGHQAFRFLNLTKSYEGSINWNDTANGLLWTYNLNYFDFLQDGNITKEEGRSLILDYLSQLDNIEMGMEPYPLSVRIINWIKFLAVQHINDQGINQSLYRQVLLLRKNPEYHLLGNHILENGFALFFAGHFFDDPGFACAAGKILKIELKRQILPDGGHIERSPMYHSLILFRILDCINLLQSKEVQDESERIFWMAIGGKMLGWLNQISFTGDSLPMVNDCADKIAPSLPDLRAYADRLGVSPVHIRLAESGYRKISTPAFELFVDMGPIGPDYQPGHAHADTFSFVLCCAGTLVITDTGTSTYSEGGIRDFERSTSAHNTVAYDQYNSSDVWKSFRVGRRANVSGFIEEPNRLIARHTGYEHLGITHQRTFQWAETVITITDELSGDPVKKAKAFLHFYPGTAVQEESGSYIIDNGKLTISFGETAIVKLCTYMHAVGFNIRQSAPKLEIVFTRRLVTQIKIGIL